MKTRSKKKQPSRTKHFVHTLRKIISTNKIVLFIGLIYTLVGLAQLSWGLPNNSHPFAYNMDEWAQAHSLMSTFKQGTPHIHGGGNGTYFFYIQSGIMLAPFVLLRLVNPFIIKSSLDAYDMQLRLFEILRLQSILYAVLSIFLISFIAQTYFKVNKNIAAFFFAINPVFFLLAHYYRYDTAVVFWIVLSLFFSLRYIKFPTTKNFLLSIIIASLAVTIKISAIPLFVTSIIPFFFVTANWQKKFRLLCVGIAIFIIVFLVTGIPDALVNSQKFFRWFYLSLGVEGNNNTDLGIPYWIYHPFITYPASFGHLGYLLFISSIVIWISRLRKSLHKISKEYGNEIFLFFAFFVFVVSFIPLKINAHGNRLMVMLPFFGLIISIVYSRLHSALGNNKKTILKMLLVFVIIFQSVESFAWLSTKLFPDPRSISAQWVAIHIPRGAMIGLEVPPIFQYIPDNLLKDYYTKEYNAQTKTMYRYQAINAQTKKFPEYVIITDEQIAQKFFKKSDKKSIMAALKKQHYKPVVTFTANYTYYRHFNDEQVFYFSALAYTPSTITLFQRTK